MLSHFTPCPSSDTGKRKRRPAGTPDPDAEVVSLSPKTLLESDQYVCEICNQGFQRDQNLQMHRRRHKVPWKLLKRDTPTTKKRVFVCPEPSCLHHDPCHALGDLVGIKKHYRRKHSDRKQWVCEKCGKGYAVQSDFKAHLKTCGTRGHSCDCGRVFSRVESFIEHQDACTLDRAPPKPLCLSRTASSPSSEQNLNNPPWGGPRTFSTLLTTSNNPNRASQSWLPNLELELLTKATTNDELDNPMELGDYHSKTQLQLSIGSSDTDNIRRNTTERCSPSTGEKVTVLGNREQSEDQVWIAMSEKANAEEARRQAKQEAELAEREFAEAKRIRHQAHSDLEKAQASREHATKLVNSILLNITCQCCRNKY